MMDWSHEDFIQKNKINNYPFRWILFLFMLSAAFEFLMYGLYYCCPGLPRGITYSLAVIFDLSCLFIAATGYTQKVAELDFLNNFIH